MRQRRFNQVEKRAINGSSAAVIQYNELDGTPKVLASGRGYVAERIKQIANDHHIHMEEDAFLIENLIDLDLGDDIPPQLYAVIAEILLMIEELEKMPRS
ncbi:EscU/YscU/HrcU family type III secretion system export apparatus switch protein [Alkalicoccus luteus]|uniref:Flagellar biosynthesis protein FlhS n=1 Tax=Alkalicoccus luteus TaxID=1237094 RepID=A0A969PT04_9BACI|nr:EscU/YscU/HrcU family type III secretion system export apparatus switch protein [Alkalicoccus luteus]NJP38803.1 flagellar biosynthesis protein FlhS [Alkalicoccus luteus]